MTRKVLKIERVGDGIRVTLADGSTTTYAKAAQVPDEIARLLSRMDADGDDGAQSGQGGADAARSAYLARLEQAHQQGQAPDDPHQGFSGRQLYEARLRDGWREQLMTKQLPSHKR